MREQLPGRKWSNSSLEFLFNQYDSNKDGEGPGLHGTGLHDTGLQSTTALARSMTRLIVSIGRSSSTPQLILTSCVLLALWAHYTGSTEEQEQHGKLCWSLRAGCCLVL